MSSNLVYCRPPTQRLRVSTPPPLPSLTHLRQRAFKHLPEPTFVSVTLTTKVPKDGNIEFGTEALAAIVVPSPRGVKASANSNTSGSSEVRWVSSRFSSYKKVPGIHAIISQIDRKFQSFHPKKCVLKYRTSEASAFPSSALPYLAITCHLKWPEVFSDARSPVHIFPCPKP